MGRDKPARPCNHLLHGNQRIGDSSYSTELEFPYSTDLIRNENSNGFFYKQNVGGKYFGSPSTTGHSILYPNDADIVEPSTPLQSFPQHDQS
ncbi:hypothetical protein H5410_040290 [Solanum commersonii]|uniref:Uncharacterized protein n=1 Tax=Solanum commersonii TaxID=4109 RepID=A0A9J5XRM3_SOLCO|nr:hypothetical protein H5410_040290 [Solanum commersonii]